MIAMVCLFAVLLDLLIGELKRWHPLVGFGKLSTALEYFLNRQHHTKYLLFFMGMLAWFILVVPITFTAILVRTLIDEQTGSAWMMDITILYLTIGFTSLRQHVNVIVAALVDANLELARQKLSLIVSRDTKKLDRLGICRATIESALENGNDAIFAPLFWFLVGGLPGALVYRMSNTLDAMWGYQNPRFLFFGRFTARMDDVLNWLPARLVALSYAMIGRSSTAFRCWREQGSLLESPAAGVVMVTGAGALQLLLGGHAFYNQKLKEKPVFGCGKNPDVHDIFSALSLISKTLMLWCLLITAFSLFDFLVLPLL